MYSRLFMAAFAALLCMSSLKAEECGPLRMHGVIALKQIDGIPQEFVPVEIAGQPKLMMLDTGAFFTTMTHKVANELKLTSHRNSIFKQTDLTGNESGEYVSAPMTIGTLKSSSSDFVLQSLSQSWDDTNMAGLLGANIFRNFDISIDFGAHTLSFIDQDHCDGKVVYWPGNPIAVIPFKLQGTEIVLQVTLDGHELTAQLDTGAGTSTLFRDKAEHKFGLVMGSADTPVSGDLNGKEGLTTWKHRFQSLSLAGLEVNNPEIHILPDVIGQKIQDQFTTGSLLDRKVDTHAPVMLIGMNVLKHLHIYIAYREKKLYITPASKPAESPAK